MADFFVALHRRIVPVNKELAFALGHKLPLPRRPEAYPWPP